MGRDYAERGRGRGRQAAAPATPGWVWLLVGVALGFAAAAGWYVTRPHVVEAIAEGDGSSEDGDARRDPVKVPPKQPSRFAFYELLPDYEVVIPKEELAKRPERPASSTVTPAAGERYLLQVGSFRARGDAERLKARIALLGIESRVEQVTIDNDQTWFRVRIGPESDPARVQGMLNQLAEDELQALVMRVPG